MEAGVQEIQIPNGNAFHVRCDGNGWMIIQQRKDGSEDFNKTWREYVDGVGNFHKEFFIGLEKLHLITSSTRYQLHISVTFSWAVYNVKYDNFRIGNSESLYKLESIGKYSGDYSHYNSLQGNVNQQFSTFDHSTNYYNCAKNGMGGWWYPRNCGET
ncbi:hypothetical protein KR044_005260, partial [Drosophila immigrans]